MMVRQQKLNKLEPYLWCQTIRVLTKFSSLKI